MTVSEKVYPEYTATAVAQAAPQIVVAADAAKPSQPIGVYHAPHVSTAVPLQQKQGAKCCGVCCDYRRAVIICDIVVFVLELIALILLATGVANIYYDDEGGEELEEHMEDYVLVEIIFSAISMVLAAVAIYGAMTYNVYLVGLNAVWLLVGCILGVVLAVNACNEWEDKDTGDTDYQCEVRAPGIVIAFIITLLWIYPHVGFIVEVSQGILTGETYEREEFSCCCV